jgi:hypothetical protein
LCRVRKKEQEFRVKEIREVHARAQEQERQHRAQQKNRRVLQ